MLCRWYSSPWQGQKDNWCADMGWIWCAYKRHEDRNLQWWGNHVASLSGWCPGQRYLPSWSQWEGYSFLAERKCFVREVHVLCYISAKFGSHTELNCRRWFCSKMCRDFRSAWDPLHNKTPNCCDFRDSICHWYYIVQRILPDQTRWSMQSIEDLGNRVVRLQMNDFTWTQHTPETIDEILKIGNMLALELDGRGGMEMRSNTNTLWEDITQCSHALAWALPEYGDDIFVRWKGSRRRGTNRSGFLSDALRFHIGRLSLEMF